MKVGSAGRGGEKRLRRLFKKRFKGVSVDEGGGEIHSLAPVFAAAGFDTGQQRRRLDF